MSIELLRIARLSKEVDDAHTELILFFEYNLPKIQNPSRMESISAAVSIAGFIQSTYTKAEDVFKSIAKNIDHTVPDGNGWHKELLEQMTLETEDRSPVISDETAKKLDKVLLFRHVVRSNYAGDLMPDKVIENAHLCIDAIQSLIDDLSMFYGEKCEPKVN